MTTDQVMCRYCGTMYDRAAGHTDQACEAVATGAEEG